MNTEPVACVFLGWKSVTPRHAALALAFRSGVLVLTMDYELNWFIRAIIAYKIKQRDAKSPGEKPGVKAKCERHFEINQEYWNDLYNDSGDDEKCY